MVERSASSSKGGGDNIVSFPVQLAKGSLVPRFAPPPTRTNAPPMPTRGSGYETMLKERCRELPEKMGWLARLEAI